MMLEFWLIFGGALIILEVLLGATIILMFTGLGALTVAGLINYGVIDDKIIIDQFCVFFVSVLLWALILFKPLKGLMNNIKASSLNNNLVGQRAIVASQQITQDKTGVIKWSGTLVNAILSKESQHNHLKENSEVIITEINNNIFTVKELSKEI